MRKKNKKNRSSPTPLSMGDISLLMSGNGKSVTAQDALGVEAYFSCIQDQCSSIGGLPIKLYKRTTKMAMDRIREASGKYAGVFNAITSRPCSFMSTQEFLEFAVSCYRMNGAFYALPFYDSSGHLEEIIPFFNQRGVSCYSDQRGDIYYQYITNSGQHVYGIPPSAMFIIKGMTLDGFTPISPLYYQASVLNIAMAQDESMLESSQDGITSQMALLTDNKFTDANARESLRSDFQRMRGGEGRKFIPVFEQGLKPFSLKLSPAEMELLSNREFTVKRVCGMLESLPHRIGSSDDSTSNNKIYELDEAQFKKWNPLLKKIEDELSRIAGSLFTVKIDRKSFYAGSPYRLVEAVEKELRGGMASLAESREDLGRDYIEGSENIFCIQSNNCIFGSWDQLQEIQTLRNTNESQDSDNNRPADKE